MKRNAAIELLRCVLMFLIVADHCYYHGIFKESQVAWTALFTTFVLWHVDCFVAISGWFGIKFSLKKFWRIYAQVLFYSLLSFVFGGKFDITGGWFGGTYLFLMMIAPLLNLMIEKLVTLPRKDILFYWGLFSGGIVLSWVPGHLFTAVDPRGIDGGSSIMMFIFLYFTVRIISLLDLSFSRKVLVSAIGGGYLSIFILAAFQYVKCYLRGISMPGSSFLVYHCYSAPHIWIIAIAVLVYVAKYVTISERFANIVRFCSPSMFAIYLIHDTTSFGKLFYIIPEEWLLLHTSLHPAVIILICSVLTYCICLAIDIIRRGLFYLARLNR